MRTHALAVGALGCSVVLSGAAATALAAEPSTVTRGALRLTASQATGLAVDGQEVRVTGTGYDRAKGIYVAFCVDNGPGQVPTPCGGGADTEGSSGSSVWISDLPPAYGTGLAQPYGENGSFDVTLVVRAQLDEETDCRVVRCGMVTRNDHTRSDDRSQDVVVPVSFGSTALPPRAAPRPSTARPSTAAAPGRPTAGGPTSDSSTAVDPGSPRSAGATSSATVSPPTTSTGMADPGSTGTTPEAGDEPSAASGSLADDSASEGHGAAVVVATGLAALGATAVGSAVVVRRTRRRPVA